MKLLQFRTLQHRHFFLAHTHAINRSQCGRQVSVSATTKAEAATAITHTSTAIEAWATHRHSASAPNIPNAFARLATPAP